MWMVLNDNQIFIHHPMRSRLNERHVLSVSLSRGKNQTYAPLKGLQNFHSDYWICSMFLLLYLVWIFIFVFDLAQLLKRQHLYPNGNVLAQCSTVDLVGHVFALCSIETVCQTLTQNPAHIQKTTQFVCHALCFVSLELLSLTGMKKCRGVIIFVVLAFYHSPAILLSSRQKDLIAVFEIERV